MSAYTIASLIKLGLGIIVLLVDFFMINVDEDPIVGISLALIWAFLFARGISYFFFYIIQDLFRSSDNRERIQKDGYKTSFIFGLYVLINILLFIAGVRERYWGILLFIAFLAMSYFIFTDRNSHAKKTSG